MIHSLRLRNFRRYVSADFEFAEGVNFIEGQNNAGKTTLLYAIEYALFGRVGSFKTPAALMHPKTKGVGVEIVFTGRDDQKYKLQRIHQKPPKSRTKVVGHYTFKQIGEDGAEQYLLSSDFDDREEALALKLQSILGFNRRTFDVAVNVRQGEIASILAGAPQLDIVLGVTAAVLAGDEMRAMALEREKEAAQLPVLHERKAHLEEEQSTAKARQAALSTEQQGLVARTEALDAVLAQIGSLADAVRPLDEAQRALSEAHAGWPAAQASLEEAKGALETFLGAHGDQGALASALSTAEAEQGRLEGEREALKGRQRELTERRSGLDGKRGDLSGRLERRHSLPADGEAACEACGQTIDRELVAREVAELEAALADLDGQLTTVKGEIEAASAESEQLGEQIQAQALAVQEATGHLSRLSALAESVERRQAGVKAAGEALKTAVEQALEAGAQCAAGLADDDTLTVDLDLAALKQTADGASDEATLAGVVSTLSEAYTGAFRKLDDEIKARRVKAETERGEVGGQLSRLQADAQEAATRLSDLARDIAGVEAQVSELEEKAQVATWLRTLAKAFKDLQKDLRERAAKDLADQTLEIHKALSGGDSEFKALTIDPARYEVEVTPTDVGTSVPAWLYQGGGHRLLLGLAFKLAVARMIGPFGFILLDEPTYGLDAAHREALLNRISDLGIARQMLLITHHDVGDVTGRRLKISRKGRTSVLEAAQ